MEHEKGLSSFEWIIVSAFLVVIGIFFWNLLDPLNAYHMSIDMQRKNDFSKIKAALDVYYGKFQMYPLSTDTTTSKPFRIRGYSPNQLIIDWGDDWSPFLSVLPKDPDKNKNYIYYSTGQAYYLYASLDRGGKDPDACHKDGSVCDNVPDGASCGVSAICNYGISSPNVYP